VVDKCIYCGRAPPDITLSDEHVIPDGLGGDLVLGQASCIDCAKMTNKFEQNFMVQGVGLARAGLGIKSRKGRRRKDPPRTFKVYEGDGVIDIKYPPGPPVPPVAEITASEDMPWGITMIVPNDRAAMLTGRPIGQTKSTARVWNPPDMLQRVAKISNSEKWGYKTILDPGKHYQTLAKIAYCYAVSVFGVDNINPYVLNFIKDSGNPYDEFIGLAEFVPWPEFVFSKTIHWIGLSTQPIMKQNNAGLLIPHPPLILVYIQLFARQRMPVFEIVAGELRNAKPTGVI